MVKKSNNWTREHIVFQLKLLHSKVFKKRKENVFAAGNSITLQEIGSIKQLNSRIPIIKIRNFLKLQCHCFQANTRYTQLNGRNIFVTVWKKLYFSNVIKSRKVKVRNFEEIIFFLI